LSDKLNVKDKDPLCLGGVGSAGEL
jgi:hypothetical protein